ncbi:hypothetical protein V6N13_102381 [Hibiscus sabdariffa]|uniref:Uncharacterized protein n=1 Tax=Hibiscus sabdariffa TaxID=183260 RepID=A0ABR2D3W4_9ROSI
MELCLWCGDGHVPWDRLSSPSLIPINLFRFDFLLLGRSEHPPLTFSFLRCFFWLGLRGETLFEKLQ